MSLQHLIDTVRGQPVIAIGALAALLALLCIALVARVERLKDRLHIAQAAAEDAARAAALAAPGGIDPDVVAELLATGQRPTLDAIYATMQRRAASPLSRGPSGARGEDSPQSPRSMPPSSSHGPPPRAA
ncbi:MAG: hypothetical protein ACRENL_09065 [Candidatus Dormibacteria bacterium]